MLWPQSTKEEIDRVNLEVQSAERDYDLNRAAELKYGTLTELQKQLREAEAALEAKVGTKIQACSLQSIAIVGLNKVWWGADFGTY